MFSMLILAGISIKPTMAHAQETSDTGNTETTQNFYKYIDVQDNLEDQITYSRLRASGDTETKAYAYDFKNYVDTQFVYNGDRVSKIKFTFTTTSWSKSTGFNVKMYKSGFLSNEYISQQLVSKSSGNPTSVTFTLEKGKDYVFRFDNTSYGEQIVGSGSWTITER